jgi:hypothetical protein
MPTNNSFAVILQGWVEMAKHAPLPVKGVSFGVTATFQPRMSCGYGVGTWGLKTESIHLPSM